MVLVIEAVKFESFASSFGLTVFPRFPNRISCNSSIITMTLSWFVTRLSQKRKHTHEFLYDINNGFADTISFSRFPLTSCRWLWWVPVIHAWATSYGGVKASANRINAKQSLSNRNTRYIRIVYQPWRDQWLTIFLIHMKWTYKKVVRMFTVIVTLFVVCWLPYHGYFVYQFIDDQVISYKYTQHVFLSFYWLAMSNTMINPLVYYYMNTRLVLNYFFKF